MRSIYLRPRGVSQTRSIGILTPMNANCRRTLVSEGWMRCRTAYEDSYLLTLRARKVINTSFLGRPDGRSHIYSEARSRRVQIYAIWRSRYPMMVHRACIWRRISFLSVVYTGPIVPSLDQGEREQGKLGLVLDKTGVPKRANAEKRRSRGPFEACSRIAQTEPPWHVNEDFDESLVDGGHMAIKSYGDSLGKRRYAGSKKGWVAWSRDHVVLSQRLIFNLPFASSAKACLHITKPIIRSAMFWYPSVGWTLGFRAIVKTSTGLSANP